MTQAIGTSWMRQPPRRQDDDPAFNQLIEKMDLDEVRRMMCPKSHGNVEKCKDCDGFKTCRPGQRAMRLVAEMKSAVEEKTAPVYVQKWKDEATPPPEPNARDEFRKACESGNAWNYLMETRGLNKDAAGELLSKMIRRFPGIAADFGGGRRIMQRPKVVKITTVDAREPASEPKVEETPAEEVKAAEQAENRPRTKRDELNAQLAEQARERCRQILASGDPVQAIVKEGKTEQQARARLHKWKANYPDLFEGIDPSLYQAKKGRKKKVAEPEKQEEQVEEDLVNLADFLEEMDATDDELVDLTEYTMNEAPQESAERPGTGDPMLEQMNVRLKELEAEKERLRAEIERAEERIKCIKDQQEALQICLATFGKA